MRQSGLLPQMLPQHEDLCSFAVSLVPMYKRKVRERIAKVVL